MPQKRSIGPSGTSITPVVILVALILLSSFTVLPALTTVRASLSPSQAVPVQSFALKEYSVPTSGGGPSGIGISAGKVWFTENLTSKLASFDPSVSNFTEWDIPTSGSEPRNIFVTQVSISGVSVTQAFFTEYGSDKIARFNSANNTFTEWQLDAGSKPVGIYVDENTDVWFTESGRDIIGRLTPSTNNLTEWVLPGATSTPGVPLLKPWGIFVQVVARTGYNNRFVWFTEPGNNMIGRLEANSNRLTLWNLGTLGLGSYGPTDITMGLANGLPVAVFTDVNNNRVSVLGNDTGGGSVYRDSVVPTGSARPMGIVFDSARTAFWFAEYNGGKIASINSTATIVEQLLSPTYCTISPAIGTPSCASPATRTSRIVDPFNQQQSGTSQFAEPVLSQTIGVYQGPLNGVTEYQLPNATSRPVSLSLGATGNIWFTEHGSNRIGYLTVPYTFQVTASPTTRNVTRGQNTTFTVNVALISGSPASAQLTLLNAPSGIGIQFTPQTGTPPFASTLKIVTTNSTPTGTFNMNVQASSGGQNLVAAITLNVQAQQQPPPPPPPTAFSYEITVTSPQTVTITQGQSTSFDLAVTLISGTSQTVNLTAVGFPTGVTYSYTVASGLPTFTSTLQVQTNANTPGGSYPIAISGLAAGGQPVHPAQSPVLVITEVPRDFTLTASVSQIMLVQGSRTNVPMTITSVGDFNSEVMLTSTLQPATPNLVVTFSPSATIPQPNGGTEQVTMQIAALMGTSGTYLLTVTATSTNPSHSHEVMFSVQVSPCLIATATFESELAPQVQFLRTFRDQQITHTFAGTNFMTVFNAFYYSFSPTVAEYEDSHAAMRGVMRVALYPLIGVLQISSGSYSAVAFQPELAALTAGLVAGSLIGLVYFALPAFSVLWVSRKRINAGAGRRFMKWIAATLVAFSVGFLISEIFTLSALMMVVGTGLVLTMLAAGSVLPALYALEHFRKRT
jgi:streptogramin lyase